MGTDSVKDEVDKQGDKYERNKGDDESKVYHDKGKLLSKTLTVVIKEGYAVVARTVSLDIFEAV